jgi:hypothetical protein
MRSRAYWSPALGLLLELAACRGRASAQAPSRAPAETSTAAPVPGGMEGRKLINRFAYIPPQCYTVTQVHPGAPAHNPCYACHHRPQAPNFVDDSKLQLGFDFPGGAVANPWRNLFAPPVARSPRIGDNELLAYVRTSNYFDGAGRIALGRRLGALPRAWDGQGDGHWDGYVPDAWFHFDGAGWDRAPDGALTGWRAFAYRLFLGTFFPTNGSTDDVLIRLAPAFREDAAGRPSAAVYALNLAVVEALITRADVPIDPVDERALGADLDLDGVLGRATRVAFRAPAGSRARVHYLGRARAGEEDGTLPLAPGLFPLGTELLHSVRYLDVAGGGVAMAPRMKELRYMKKVRWLTPADLQAHAAAEATEQAESPDGSLTFLWQFDRGIYNAQGWLLQGFIEAADGSLRPQSYEESLTCVGCHGELGATTDSVFSFARKLGARSPARGWFHWTQHDLRGLPEPRRRDGRYEYTRYLEANGAGDDLRENREAQAAFFDAAGAPRPAALARLHTDVATLLLPSPARALDLDRAYLAVVREQSFVRGRDAVLAPSHNVHERVSAGARTGVVRPLTGPATPLSAGGPAQRAARPCPNCAATEPTQSRD